MSSLQNGWDDDDEDLDMDEGWGDDDDDLNFDEEELPVAAAVVPQQQQQTPATATEDDGWGDDDDLDLGDDDDVEINHQKEASPSSPMHVPAVGATTSTSAVPPPSVSPTGWEDDDDLNFDDDEEDTNMEPSMTTTPEILSPPVNDPSQSVQVDVDHSSEAMGWDDDDDLFDESSPTPVRPVVEAAGPSDDDHHRKKVEILLTGVRDYISSLDRMQSSINAVLEFEYNTPEKAQELIEYYDSRPALAAYTKDKELHRMDYRVVLPHGDVEMDKAVIRDYHLPQESLLSRCSNQSILADLLQVLTGPDLVVRPQFHASCLATRCLFQIHLGEEHGGQDNMVHVKSELTLSLPTTTDRLDIAKVQVSIVFAPYQQMVEFKVHNIIVQEGILEDTERLQEVADLLCALDVDLNDLSTFAASASGGQSSADTFRDAFLENTHEFLSQKSKGMKSALQQMESVVNLKSKLTMVKKLIPDTEQLLAAAEEEAMAVAASRDNRPPQHTDYPPQHHAPPATLPAGAGRGEETQRNRPKSILGGFVRSGWSALAKTVAIPDEDPSLYHDGPSSLPTQFPRPPPPPPKEERLFPVNSALAPPSNNITTQQSSIPATSPSSAFSSSLTEQQHTARHISDPQTRHQSPMSKSTPGQPSLALSRLTGESKAVSELPVQSSPMKSCDTDGAQKPHVSITHNIQQTESSVPKMRTTNSPSPLIDSTYSTGGTSMLKPDLGAQPEPSNRVEDPKTEDGGDGWDDDDDLLDLSESGSPTAQGLEERVDSRPAGDFGAPQVSSPKKVETEKPKRLEKKPIVDAPYNPEDDILPSRKRWVNPRPHRPYLVS